MIVLSIIVCTHNPRAEYLRRVLDALKAQTLQKDQWELLLIDNASNEPLAATWDLSWHRNARNIREDELGLIPARLRGISESRSELILFIDDDNVLDARYLEEALLISRQWSMLGAWGGNIEGEFEVPPSDDLIPLLPLLAIRTVTTVQWSNGGIHRNHAIPIGAGMCVRRVVATAYVEAVSKNPCRKQWDRQGVNLASSGDADLAFTACDVGFGTGLFPSLRLKHLIPAGRVQRAYLLNLDEEVEFGHRLLFFVREAHCLKIPATERFLVWYAMLRHRGLRRDQIRSHWHARLRFTKVARKLMKEGFLSHGNIPRDESRLTHSASEPTNAR